MNNIYLAITFYVLVHFTWFYITLPDSIILTQNKKKPPISKALLSYLLLFGPFVMFILLSKGQIINHFHHIINTVCKLQCLDK
jgi:hypothetical protein